MPATSQIDVLLDWWDGEGIDFDPREIRAAMRASASQSPARPEPKPPPPPKAVQPALIETVGGVQEAVEAARNAATLEDLEAAVRAFEGCELKKLATNSVFADGTPDADLMIIGEGPGRDEDLKGFPFVGKSGQLLDKMFAAIGYRRTENLYITNVNYWRPPGNRNPTPEEVALCAPFVERHIELIAPKLIVATGAVAARALLATSDGIMRLRGRQLTYQRGDLKIPLIPTMHPAYLLRRPQDKAKAWQDLLLIEHVLETQGVTGQNRP